MPNSQVALILTMPELRAVIREELEPLKNALTRGTDPTMRELPRGEFMTNVEAMKYLGLSRATLARYRANGTLAYSKVGQKVFYRRADVEALLEGRMVKRADCDGAHACWTRDEGGGHSDG